MDRKPLQYEVIQERVVTTTVTERVTRTISIARPAPTPSLWKKCTDWLLEHGNRAWKLVNILWSNVDTKL